MCAKFVMTYMDPLLFDSRWNVTPGIEYLQQKIRPYLHQFDSLNFVEWSQQKGYPIGSVGNHPLEAAHKSAFELIQSYNLV